MCVGACEWSGNSARPSELNSLAVLVNVDNAVLGLVDAKNISYESTYNYDHQLSKKNAAMHTNTQTTAVEFPCARCRIHLGFSVY